MKEISLSVPLTAEDLDGAAKHASMEQLSLVDWVRLVAVREAWRITEVGERDWPPSFIPRASEGQPFQLTISYPAFVALSEAADETFYWHGGQLERLDVASFVAFAVRRTVSRALVSSGAPR